MIQGFKFKLQPFLLDLLFLYIIILFPYCRLIMTPKNTSENIVEKGGIAHDCSIYHNVFNEHHTQLLFSFPEIFTSFTQIFSKSSAVDLLYVGMG